LRASIGSPKAFPYMLTSEIKLPNLLGVCHKEAVSLKKIK
jgi:hypothetical protein